MTRVAGIAVLLVVMSNGSTAAIELMPSTIAAWTRYTSHRPASIPECDGCETGAPRGRQLAVPGGTIHHWTGSTIVRNTRVDEVVKMLMYPGTPPPQEDVLDARVLSRTGNSLRVYLKVARQAIVTVTYDTEHEVTFYRYSANVAESRSVSTKITEVGDSDHGFLWRLNSYWRYTQVGSNVRIDLDSVSLSRPVPAIARPIAGPLIDRVARESLERTLTSVRSYLELSRTRSGRSFHS
jgi:hypothetical protein